MRILDKYIAREFLRTYFIIFFSFAAVFIVIDIIDNLPRLIRFGASFSQATIYYILRLPYLVVLTSPVTILLTGLFMMNNLSKYNESVAIRAAGISIKRAMMPLFVIGFVISILIGIFGEYLLPYTESKRDYVYRVLIKNEEPEDQMLKARINFEASNGYYYYFGFFDGYKNTIRIIDIIKLNNKTHSIIEHISAAAADWKNNVWILQDCEIRKFDQQRQISWQHYDRTVIPAIDVKPQDFIRITKKTIAMNYFELQDYIHRIQKLGEKANREIVDLNMKIAYPLTNLIVIFFFIPIATTNVRSKGRGWVFMLGLTVCFMYLIILRILQSLGYNNVLPPIMAAWLPNIFFTLLGIGFLYKAEI